ncbi:MAG: prepilin peptidase [Candidatus Eisenbacteria sp.]|nr:prepilin peptidase [Candidatus Eisenbacteria bacterium]
MTEAALFIIGSILGSFFNVVIYRVPRGGSIIRPPSACPACGTRLRAWDNIPVLGYLLLRGKCRYCAAPISARYPIVEVLSGILPVLLFIRFGASVPFYVFWPLSCVLLVLSFIDLDLRIIPDWVTLPGIAVGLIVAPLVGLLGFWGSLLGVLVGGGALYLIGILGEFFLKKESMGGGDVKLAAMLGAFMGWKLVLFALFVAFFAGAVVGVIVMARKPKHWDSSLPFGPFIALGAVLALLWGESALGWYSSLLG